MRAAVLSPDLELTVERRDRPEPAAEEALVRIERVGICGSDVHYYEHGHIGDYVVDAPLVLGHESAGVVEAVGDDAERLEPGARVALEPGVPCRRCEHCRRGEYNLCPDVTFMATPPDDGAFADYVAWPADFVYELPDAVSLTEGALIEPLSVGVHVARRAGVGVGDSALIAGAGPIGLLAMEALRAAGASEVYLSDVVDSKLDLARERGADATVNGAESDLREEVGRLTDGRGVDVAVDAAGVESTVRGCLDAARRGGTVVLVGLGATEDVPVDTGALVDDELDVLGSFRYRNTYGPAVDLLTDGAVDVAGIVDFESSLDRVDEAFRRAGDPEVVKGMIRVGDAPDRP
jgi:L-iditol 2-dehydrogenase